LTDGDGPAALLSGDDKRAQRQLNKPRAPTSTQHRPPGRA